jgi:hypothetical protein
VDSRLQQMLRLHVDDLDPQRAIGMEGSVRRGYQTVERMGGSNDTKRRASVGMPRLDEKHKHDGKNRRGGESAKNRE